MTYFLQQIIYGLSIGCVYALIAMGYTMVHAIIGQINLAHGMIFMIGAYGAFIAFVFVGIIGAIYAFLPAALVVVLMAAMLTASAYSWSAGRLLYHGLRPRAGHAPLIATIGLLIFLQEYVRLVQAGGVWLAPLLTAKFLYRGADGFVLVLSAKHLLIAALTALAVALHGLFVARTAFGRAQRACAQDRAMAEMLGVDVRRVIGLTFVVGGALAALAGFFSTLHYGVVGPYMGFLIGLKAFTAAMLGGLGSLPGAVAGGLIIGLVETFWSGYLPGDYRDVFIFAILVAVLVFRPSGLFGAPSDPALPGAGAARR